MKRVSNVLGQLEEKKDYFYTDNDVAPSILSKEQRDFYEKNGYIVIKNLLNTAAVKRYFDRFDELVANPKERPFTITIMRDVSLKNLSLSERSKKGERVVTKLQTWSKDRVLWDYAKDKNILKYVNAIVGENLRGVHFMEINKPKDPGFLSSRHPLHQDQWYFPFGPSERIVCSWTALQKVNRNNGCLVAIPGTHKYRGGKLFRHGYPEAWKGKVNKAYHGILPEKDDFAIEQFLSKRVHLEMDPGDTVYFHPLLLHASGANLSGKNRRSISVHYVNTKKTYFDDVKKYPSWRRTIVDEIEAMGKRKTGLKIPFKMIWKNKSRQVQGSVGNWKN